MPQRKKNGRGRDLCDAARKRVGPVIDVLARLARMAWLRRQYAKATFSRLNIDLATV
jgi:hypothetical protein